ncbi:MAG: MBL fold metallo-hydrolase [Burkholderiales bacterium]|nr:MBL fold metallo-hydrolase [Burkholderiales bacterium]
MPLKCAILPVTPFQQNCSIVWDDATRGAAVVDPGGDLGEIKRAAAEHALAVEKILLTHGHIDHAGGAAELARELGVPIEGPHRDEQFWIDLLPGQAREWGFPPAAAFTPDRWLAQGDTVAVGGLALEVRHCPGHTPGHVIFFHAPSRLAIVGDVLFRGSIGRTDFPRGDQATLLRSIREQLFTLGDDVTFVPGHGPLSTIGEERRTNPFVADALA